MTRTEMIAAIADRTGVSRLKTASVLEVWVEMAAGELCSGETVRLLGFGSFEPIVRAAMSGRNPRTGEEIAIAASRRVKFRPSAALKDRLKLPAATQARRRA
jgi:DNA-binding protein HU-beta